MPVRLTAARFVDRESLQIRCRLIEIAAALDRIDAGIASDATGADPRVQRIHEAIHLLADDQADRARRIQMLFSLPYDRDWRTE